MKLAESAKHLGKLHQMIEEKRGLKGFFCKNTMKKHAYLDGFEYSPCNRSNFSVLLIED